MRLCLSCYHLWPGDALLCGHCARSFGGRLCARHHRSPASARCCVQCGLTELTVPTRSFPLGWFPLLLIWGCVILLGLWGWHQVGSAVEHGVRQIILYAAGIAIVLALIPGKTGRHLRRGALRVISVLGRLLFLGLGYRLARETVRIMAAIIKGQRRRP